MYLLSVRGWVLGKISKVCVREVFGVKRDRYTGVVLERDTE